MKQNLRNETAPVRSGRVVVLKETSCKKGHSPILQALFEEKFKTPSVIFDRRNL